MEQLASSTYKALYNASKHITITVMLSPEKTFPSAKRFICNEDKENGQTVTKEGQELPYVSPSPSKFIERRRGYFRGSTDRKEGPTFELDSVKKTLRFENQPGYAEGITSNNLMKKRVETAMQMKGAYAKSSANILKMR